MRPYLLVIHNKIKILLKRLSCKGLISSGILMMGRNTKLALHSNSRVTIGDRFVSDGRLVIMTGEDARLTIGEQVYFNEDAMISCKGEINIGKGCRFGPNVKIFDNNHKFDAENGVSAEHKVGGVDIGENCWIGANVVILKGARIGRNCVIGAGCVVSERIPDAMIVTQGRDLQIEAMRK